MLLDSRWISMLRNMFDELIHCNTKRPPNLYHTFNSTHELVPLIQNNEYHYGL